jgi:hypothetical protein
MGSRLVGLALAVVSSAWASGCCVGKVSRWDGNWPIDPAVTRDDVHLAEAGGGADGVICSYRSGGAGATYMLATSDGVRKLTFVGSLEGAVVQGDRVYRIEHGAVVRRAIEDSTLSPPTTIFKGPGARALSVLAGAKPDDETLVVAAEGSVLLVRQGVAREVWQGDALAVALADAERVWVAGRSLAVIDLVRLADGHVLTRVPLPLELETPSLRIVPSGGSAVVYAHDRPLESALLVTPALGIATPLRATWSWNDKLVPRFEPEADPPLIVPAGTFVGARLALGGDPGHVFGRVAPFPGSRFLVVADSEQARELTIAVIGSTVAPDVSPGRSTILTPEGWDRTVEGVGWDAKGVVLASGNTVLHVPAGGAECRLDDPHSAGDVVRRGTNHFFNAIVATVELGVSIPAGVALGSLVAPFGPPIMFLGPLIGGPQMILVGGAATLAPVWFPFFRF